MAENLNCSEFSQAAQTGNATGCLWERFHRDACGDLSIGPLYQFTYLSLMLTNKKPLEWIGSSHKNSMALPAVVRRLFGYALWLSQSGDKHDAAKVLKGFGGAGVYLRRWKTMSAHLPRRVHRQVC